jgi:hypothetical protein
LTLLFLAVFPYQKCNNIFGFKLKIVKAHVTNKSLVSVVICSRNKNNVKLLYVGKVATFERKLSQTPFFKLLSVILDIENQKIWHCRQLFSPKSCGFSKFQLVLTFSFLFTDQ